MAQVKSEQNPILERGDIYFLYRPRVEHSEAHGVADVERLYIVLKPWRSYKYQLMIAGRKKLPDPEEHNCFWAFVWKVFHHRAELDEKLRAKEYETKTTAEGMYAIVGHGNHTHLTYVLERPKREGPVERELNIKRKGSYVVAVKNPESESPHGSGLKKEHEARFPTELQETFNGRRFHPVDPPEFLNYEGAELLLIGARENAEQELGIKFRPDAENEHSADILRELKLHREVVREPLFKGQWK